jgi:V/A-type H+-transporting ATPase subunit I
MALGMVTGGIAMAVNIIAGIVGGVPVVGIILAAIVLIGGHLFNLAINALGAFVHTLRLQYVEFFPKFFTGGGRKFAPFSRDTRYTLIRS